MRRAQLRQLSTLLDNGNDGFTLRDFVNAGRVTVAGKTAHNTVGCRWCEARHRLCLGMNAARKM
ncbi:MAG: hypothetical protein H6937_02000 [Burkholderiales bacterium]|nr:hypothetical protein [Burkholderiales bacterium]MDR4517928.1 hypothetical protein [Nitrosomonas sp.]